MFLDTRLGNMPRLWLTPPKDWNMRTPDEIRQSVVFVGRTIQKGSVQERTPRATAFLVGVPSEKHPDISYSYLVTARHVAKQLSLGGSWFVRFTARDGSIVEGLVPDGSGWRYHPTEPEEVDAAVMEIAPPNEAIFKLIHQRLFLAEEMIKKHNIGEGDLVFITGLFTKMSGRRMNIPLVRTGNIAMLPSEKIPIIIDKHDPKARSVESEVYLIEARSIGGLSGSPVYVRESVFIKEQVSDPSSPGRQVHAHATGATFLLGLAQGHWDVFEENMNDVEVATEDSGKDEKRGVNLGIAIVVPAKKILEILNQPSLVLARQQHDREYEEAEGASTPDANLSS